jgi:hypothetical protein
VLALIRHLADIDAMDRPPGLTKFLTDLDRPRPSICRRNLVEELMQSPVCGCGYVPGQHPEGAAQEHPGAAIEEHFTAYVNILRRPEIREALSARIYALSDAEPDTAERLGVLARRLSDESVAPVTLIDALDPATVKDLSQALSGRVPVKRRRLNQLTSILGGRRLTPNQVRQTVEKWVSSIDEKEILSIEEEPGTAPADLKPLFSWWPGLHPEVFSRNHETDHADVVRHLERYFPAERLYRSFRKLDTTVLVRFVQRELFHIQAIRAAWLTLAERIVGGAQWPERAAGVSRYVESQTAGEISKRLSDLSGLAMTRRCNWPRKLKTRLHLASLMSDPWTTLELGDDIMSGMEELNRQGEEWLASLPAVAPIETGDNPVVVIFDAVSPDVWLAACEHTGNQADLENAVWFRLESEPKTRDAIAAMFGFSDDPIEAFDARGMVYQQIMGNETNALLDLLPEISPTRTTVIRIALIDRAAHSARFRLSEMPKMLHGLLMKDLPVLRDLCAGQHRPLILTTDHGLSLTQSGLTHGKGGVFERALFRCSVLCNQPPPAEP